MVRIVKKPEVRRLEILTAAHQLFENKGYEKTTMRDVMEAVGIAKGTIYHYFKSKEEILEAVVAYLVNEGVSHIQKQMQAASGNVIDKMRLLISASNFSEDNLEILEQLNQPGNGAMHTRQLAITIQQLAPIYADVIQQGCQEGIFHTETPLECAEFLLAGIQFLTDLGIHTWKQEALLRRAMAFPAMIEALLQAPKDSFKFLIEQL
ncbi:MAG: TetR/AcrR family transcriptional regulator [Anaerolineaceae bacterium]|nr:TetR/AcrR family transcriptional regulator [Anaerolineaceae bacterium]